MTHSTPDFPKFAIALLCMFGCFVGIVVAFVVGSNLVDYYHAGSMVEPVAGRWDGLDEVSLGVDRARINSGTVTVHGFVPDGITASQFEGDLERLVDSVVDVNWNIHARQDELNTENRPGPFSRRSGIGAFADGFGIFLLAGIASFVAFGVVLIKSAQNAG